MCLHVSVAPNDSDAALNDVGSWQYRRTIEVNMFFVFFLVCFILTTQFIIQNNFEHLFTTFMKEHSKRMLLDAQFKTHKSSK